MPSAGSTNITSSPAASPRPKNSSAASAPSAREVLDRHMIDARGAPVGRHFRVRRKQVRRGVHLVNQAEPDSSFHSLFQSRQHAVRPNRRFDPRPSGADFSDLLSRCRHCRRVGFRRFVHSTSISLRPFAPRALPRFLARMDALTPERPVLRVLIRDNERRTCLRSGLLVSCIQPSDRSASNHLLPPPGFGLVSVPELTARYADRIPFGDHWRHLGFAIS